MLDNTVMFIIYYFNWFILKYCTNLCSTYQAAHSDISTWTHYNIKRDYLYTNVALFEFFAHLPELTTTALDWWVVSRCFVIILVNSRWKFVIEVNGDGVFIGGVWKVDLFNRLFLVIRKVEVERDPNKANIFAT